MDIKKQSEMPDRYYPGVYSFNFPYVGNAHDIGFAEVELHVGTETGVNQGTNFLITAIVKSPDKTTPPLEHFIEEVCTKVRLALFDRLAGENVNAGILWPEDRIRWFQVLPYYQSGIWKQVSMKWSAKNAGYYEPSWNEMQPLLSNVNEG
jgi:hypothetical protein